MMIAMSTIRCNAHTQDSSLRRGPFVVAIRVTAGLVVLHVDTQGEQLSSQRRDASNLKDLQQMRLGQTGRFDQDDVPSPSMWRSW